MPPTSEWIPDGVGLDLWDELNPDLGFISEGTAMAAGSAQNPAESVKGDGSGWPYPIDDFIEQGNFAQISDGPTAIPTNFPVDALSNVDAAVYAPNPMPELDETWGFLPENPLVSLPTNSGYENIVAPEASQQLTDAYQNNSQATYDYRLYQNQATAAAPNDTVYEYPPPDVCGQVYYVPSQPAFVPAPTQEEPSLFFPDTSAYADQRRVSAASGSDRRKRSDLSNYSHANTTDTEELHELRRTRKVRTRGPAKHVQYKPEKPQARADKPWVRQNTTTEGLTSRTGKINNYRPVYYEDRPHPIGGPWETPNGYTFDYTDKWEFSEKTYSAEQLNDFIFHYPRDKNKHSKLTIWIQKSSTDCAFRYQSERHNKCRFRDCPANVYGNGVITVGHPRVAFDERWHEHGMNVDPYCVAGYAHLYCMERFLDFEAICKLGIVKVDERVFRQEPNGRFAATLDGEPEAFVAAQFIKAAMKGKLRLYEDLPQFKNYPIHSRYRHGRPKPHDDTLTFWMMEEADQARPPSQVYMFWKRGLSGTQGLVNKGNVELVFRAKLSKKNARRKARANGNRKKKGAEDDWDSDEELEQAQDEELRVKLEKAKTYCLDKLQDFPKFHNPNAGRTKKAAQPVSKTSKRKRKVIEIDEDEDEPDEPQEYGSEDDDDQVPGPRVQGSRQSPRLRNKTRQVTYDIPSPVEPYDSQPRNAEGPAPKRQRRQYSRELGSQDATEQYPGHVNDPYQSASYSGFDFYNLDPSDPDYALADDLSKQLTRRRSSLSTARYYTRGASVLKSVTSSPKASDRRKVSIGGVTTHLFDTSASPKAGLRRSPRMYQ